MRRLSFAVLAWLLVAALLLAGCAAAPPGGAEMAGADGSASAGAPEGRTEIEFWHSWAPEGAQGVVLQTMFDEYNESQENYFVTSIFMGEARDEKIAAGLAAGEPPNIAWLAGSGEVYYEAGQLIPMEEVFQQSIAREDFIPGMLEGQAYLDMDISIPFENSSLAIYYNQDMLDEMGVEIPPAEIGAWTWSDFIEAAAQFSDSENGKYGWDPRLNTAVMDSMFWSAGGEYLSDDYKTNLICSDAEQAARMEKVLQRFYDILYTDQITANDTGDNGFSTGDMPFEITGPWAWPRYAESLENMGVGAFPADEDTGLSISYWYQKALAAFNTTPEENEATLDFLAWFYSPEIHARWSVDAGYLPITISATEHPIWQEYAAETPRAQIFMEQATLMKRRLSGIPYGDLGLMLDTVKFDEGTPAEAIETYCQDAQLLLDEFWERQLN